MTAVGLGQQGSQGLGSGSSHGPAKYFTIFPYHFSIPEISETLKDSSTEIFGTVRQKIFHGKS